MFASAILSLRFQRVSAFLLFAIFNNPFFEKWEHDREKHCFFCGGPGLKYVCSVF